MAISRPLKWHGGKTYLADWHQSLAPAMGSYVTRIHAYAGGLGEFWNWPHEGVAEVVNDLNAELSNFWRVLQQPQLFEQFKRIVDAVPLSQPVWEAACEAERSSAVGEAVAFFIRYRQSRQGLGKSFATLTRTRARRGMNEQVSSWLSAVKGLPEAHARMIRAAVLNMPAVRLIQREDAAEAFFYLDPPYLHDTRNSTNDYEHEMTWEDHVELCGVVSKAKGKVMLCNYPNPMYDILVSHFGWHRYDKEIDNKASNKSTKDKKIESVYLNYLPITPTTA